MIPYILPLELPNKDGKLYVPIEYVKFLKEELNKINNHPLENIVFTENYKPINLSKETIERYKFIGISNVYFILDGFYEENDSKL